MYETSELHIEIRSLHFGLLTLLPYSIHEEQREVRERLLSFGAESFVFYFVIQKYED